MKVWYDPGIYFVEILLPQPAGNFGSMYTHLK